MSMDIKAQTAAAFNIIIDNNSNKNEPNTSPADGARDCSNARGSNTAAAAAADARTAATPNTTIFTTTTNNDNATVVGGLARDDEIEATSNSDAANSNTAAPGKYPRDRLNVHVEKAIAAFKASNSRASFVT